MITLFDKNTTDFSNNGLIEISKYATVAQISEEQNGAFELEIQLTKDPRLNVIDVDQVLRVPTPMRETPEIEIYTPPVLGNVIYRVKAKSTYLRLGAGTSYKIRASLKKDTLVIVKSGTTWFKVVTPSGSTGYVQASAMEYDHTEYLSPAHTETISPKQTRDQLFRIYSVVRTLEGIEVKARHIFYDLLGNSIITALGGTNDISGSIAAERILSSTYRPHDFKAISDVSQIGSIEIENKNPVEAILGDGGWVETYGGEVMRDDFDIYFKNSIGFDRGVTLAWRKNVTGMDVSVDISNVITQIIPIGYAKNGDPIKLDSLTVDSAHMQDYDNDVPRIMLKEYRDIKVGEGYANATAVKNALRAAAEAELENGIDLPEVSVSVNYVDLKKILPTEEFRAYTEIFMGDTVHVRHEDYGFDFEVKCLAYTWDCLREEYISIELGSRKASLSNLRIDPSLIKNSSITSRKLADGSVDSIALGNGAVGSDKIENGAVTTAKIALLAVESAQINDAAITAAKIADAAITKAKIANAAIGTAQIENAAITTAKIGDGQISSAKIGDAAITTAHIVLGAITTALIEQGAVGTAQIADASITDAKIVELSANRITTGTLAVERLIIVGTNKSIVYAINEANDTPQLSYSTLDGGALTQRSITADRIVAGAITANEIAAATILANNIAAGAITTDKLAAGSVETASISAAAQAALKIAASEYVDEHGVHTSSITLDGDRLEILSTGTIKINAGARFDVSAGSAQGEYMGIHNTDLGGEFAIFTGADDASGANGRFRVNHNGEAWLKDAHVSGSLEVTHDENGDTDDVVFGENVTFDMAESAAVNLLAAVPLQRARERLRTLQGSGAPTDAYTEPQYGDRYTQISPVQDYADYVFSPTLIGFSRVVTQPQKRIQRVYSYYRTSGPSIDQPADYTTDSGYTAQGSATLGEPTPEAASCYVSGVTYTSPRSSQSTTQRSVTNGLWSGLEVCITTTYYRDRISTSHYAITTAPIPITGTSGVLDVSRFISSAAAAFTRSISTSRTYKLLTASDPLGSDNRHTLGTITATNTSSTFDIKQTVGLLAAGDCYLILERDDAASDNACDISALSIVVSYASSNAAQCEYVYNGQEWVELGGAPAWMPLTLSNGTSDNTSYGNGRLRIRKVGAHVYVAGGVTITPSSSAVLIANLGYGVKHRNQYFLQACGGSRVARLYVSTNGGLYLEWVRDLNNASAYTSSVWVDCNIDFWTD